MASDQAPKASGSGTNFLIVGVSVLLIAALMGWLVMQDRGDAQADVVAADSTGGAPAAVSGAAPTQTVSDTVFEQNAKNYVGQVVEITKVKYSAGLSPQTFWIELPSGAPFLVKLDSAMVAAGTPGPTGGELDIIGTVKQKDNALVAEWLQSGVLQDEGQRQQAEFGTTYIEARQIRPASK